MSAQQVQRLRITANWRRIVPTMVTLSALFFGFASILSTIEAIRAGSAGSCWLAPPST